MRIKDQKYKLYLFNSARYMVNISKIIYDSD